MSVKVDPLALRLGQALVELLEAHRCIGSYPWPGSTLEDIEEQEAEEIARYHGACNEYAEAVKAILGNNNA